MVNSNACVACDGPMTDDDFLLCTKCEEAGTKKKPEFRYMELVSDEQLDKIFVNTRFWPDPDKRYIIKDTLAKCLAGYSTQSTARFICTQLGLIFPHRWALTAKGKKYLGEYILENK